MKRQISLTIIILLIITFFCNNNIVYADLAWLESYKAYGNYTGKEAMDESILDTMVTNLNSLSPDEVNSLTNDQKDLCKKLIIIINNDANKNYRNANQTAVSKLAEFEKKLTGTSTVTDNSNTSGNTTTNTDKSKGAEYWHSSKQQTLLDMWSGSKSLPDDVVQSFSVYFNSATLEDLQALTQSDIDSLIGIMSAAEKSSVLKQEGSQYAEVYKKFAIRLQTVNIDGKHVASDSQIATLKAMQERYKKVEEIANAEKHNENVINNPNTGAVNPDDLEIVEDDRWGSGTTGDLLGNENSNTKHTLGEIIREALGFTDKGSGDSVIETGNLKGASDTLYNILLGIGIALAVIVGMYLGIKFMLASAEDKAKVKESLIPYIAGCVVMFSTFTIWKLVVLVLKNIG